VLVLVATGSGALLAASSIAFTIVKWFGAAYLVWLGAAMACTGGGRRCCRRGRELAVRVAALRARLSRQRHEPKAIVFMLAVLPQFIDPSRPLAAQYAACGATLVFSDLVVMTAYTAFAAKALRLFRRPRQIRVINRTFGGLLVAMGALLATFKRAA
jgi:homoserine/homoserine lactone efflux protein